MNLETALLDSLKRKQQEHAFDSMRRPDKRDAFEYGYRVGVMAGLEEAVKVLLKLLDEEKNGENDI